MWRRACFNTPVEALPDRVFKDKVVLAPKHLTTTKVINPDKTQTFAAVTVDQWPEFTITSYDHAANPPVDDGWQQSEYLQVWLETVGYITWSWKTIMMPP